jgi:hypothetical protein
LLPPELRDQVNFGNKPTEHRIDNTLLGSNAKIKEQGSKLRQRIADLLL